MEVLRAWLEAERGRSSSLASALKITQGAISQWRQVPADKVIEVESLTGISRHELRADVFGPTPKQGQAA